MAQKKKRKIILASTSAGRKELLRRSGIAFSVEASGYEEDMSVSLTPHELVKTFSQGKARAVVAKHTDAIVIGADSVAVLDGKALGKPKTKAEAKKMLESLNGRTHTFLTGFTIIDTKTGKEITKYVESTVIFRKLRPADITAYITSGEPMEGHAAGYAAQGRGAFLLAGMKGEYTNTLGLPMGVLAETMLEFGVNLLGQ